MVVEAAGAHEVPGSESTSQINMGYSKDLLLEASESGRIAGSADDRFVCTVSARMKAPKSDLPAGLIVAPFAVV